MSSFPSSSEDNAEKENYSIDEWFPIDCHMTPRTLLGAVNFIVYFTKTKQSPAVLACWALTCAHASIMENFGDVPAVGDHRPNDEQTNFIQDQTLIHYLRTQIDN